MCDHIFELYNNFLLTMIIFSSELVPSNFRYTSVTSNNITFQWNSLTEAETGVNWYVIRCFGENISYMVRK